jgi:hypothetical protein
MKVFEMSLCKEQDSRKNVYLIAQFHGTLHNMCIMQNPGNSILKFTEAHVTSFVVECTYNFLENHLRCFLDNMVVLMVWQRKL